jgi:hypothetical protein
LLTHRHGMSNLYRGVSEEKIFRNRPIRNKNCLWQPCLLMNRDEMSTLYRGPPIDASYQVSVHLAKRFQRRRFLTRSSRSLLSLTWFSIWHRKLIENGGVTHNFESGPPKDHFNSNFWAKDFDVIFIS